ncbi:hypothetical protein ACO1JD_00870, partial [Staphylococcus aureus]
METIFDYNQIKQIIPHRQPFLLIDKVVEYEGALDSAYYHADASIKLTDGKEVKSLLQMLLLHAIPTPVI